MSESNSEDSGLGMIINENGHVMKEMSDVLSEWQQKPFVDLVSVLSEDGCPVTHPEVFLAYHADVHGEHYMVSDLNGITYCSKRG